MVMEKKTQKKRDYNYRCSKAMAARLLYVW